MSGKKDIVLIAAVIVLAAVLFGVSRLMPKTDLSEKTADTTLAPDAVEYLDATAAPDANALAETGAPVVTEAPAETVAPAATEAPKQAAVAGPMPPPKAEKVRGHVVLTVGGRQYGDPIPMDRDKIITIRQENGEINKVHITPEKVYMEYSSCDNQDCVQQGEIHMDTYKTRILGTYVICLPNNVTVEMVPAE